MAARRRDVTFDGQARRLCPPRTDGQVCHELVPPAGRRLTAEAARAAALDRVAAVVARTCEWGEPGTDWDVGDHRFLVLDFSPKKDVGLYVQLWTEPGDAVLIEASSGAWNPPTRPYVQAPQRAALRKRGFRVGGRARNYQKYWTLTPAADARALAEELVFILVDVFGYRAQVPLEMTYCAGARTVEGRLFPALAVDDVKRMLGMAGCRVVDAEPIGPVTPDVRRRLIHVAEPFPMVVEMRGQATKTPATFEAMRLVTVLPAGRGLPPDALESIVRECPFARTFRDQDGDLLFIADLVAAGTSVQWFLMALRVWMHMRDRAVGMLQFALSPAAPGRAGGSGGGEGPEPGEPEAGDDEAADPDGDAGGPDDEGGDPDPPRHARVTVH
jgi:hypothetical protein